MHFIWVGKVQSCPRLHICITTNGHGNSIPLLNKDARYSLDRGKDPEYVCNTHQFLVKKTEVGMTNCTSTQALTWQGQ